MTDNDPDIFVNPHDPTEGVGPIYDHGGEVIGYGQVTITDDFESPVGEGWNGGEIGQYSPFPDPKGVLETIETPAAPAIPITPEDRDLIIKTTIDPARIGIALPNPFDGLERVIPDDGCCPTCHRPLTEEN